MTSPQSILTRSSSIVSRKTDNEYVLVPVTNNIADMNSVFTLNETGSYIWEKIDGTRTVKDIVNELITEYDIDRETAEKDVNGFVTDMYMYLIIS
jgi:methyltransferase-like protein